MLIPYSSQNGFIYLRDLSMSFAAEVLQEETHRCSYIFDLFLPLAQLRIQIFIIYYVQTSIIHSVRTDF
jgi:hypothetical protein